MSSYTPGPWKLHTEDPYTIVLSDGTQFSVLPPIELEGGAFTTGRDEANARLIVKAPEMVELLRFFAEFFEGGQPVTPSALDTGDGDRTVEEWVKGLLAEIDGEE